MFELASLYPATDERLPLPWFFLPLSTLITVAGLYVGAGRKLYVIATSLALVGLMSLAPCFTAGDPQTDVFALSVPFFQLLAYLDRGVLAEQGGDDPGGSPPRFVGRPGAEGKKPGKGGRSREDTEPGLDRAWWAVLLHFGQRGIGWNYQVKGVPAHPRGGYSRLRFVTTGLGRAAWFLSMKLAAHYAISFLSIVNGSGPSSPLLAALSSLGVGLATILWAWYYISYSYETVAVATVLVGIFEPWEWPPVTGWMGDAWSVRQAWGTSYHQLIRRSVGQPGIYLCRYFGLGRGTWQSRFLQLYLAFFLSYLGHYLGQYAIDRCDHGEFAFFMSQPVIITVEDLFREHIWVRYRRRPSDIGQMMPSNGFSFSTVFGIVWTVFWLSLTASAWSNDAMERGGMGTSGVGEAWVVDMSQRHARMVMGTY